MKSKTAYECLYKSMKTFDEWLVENSMRNAAGYLIDGKAFCPDCAKRPLAPPPEAVPLTPSALKKALQGSRPEADSAAGNSRPGGPSYKCNGQCGRRFMNEGSWQYPERPWFSETSYGSCCDDCYEQLDKENKGEFQTIKAMFGDTCDTCDRTSTNWEWVKAGGGNREQRLEELERMGF